MRVAVTGDPAYDRPDRVRWIMRWYAERWEPYTMIDTGAGGPNALAVAAATVLGFPVIACPADQIYTSGRITHLLAFGKPDEAVLSLARRNGVIVGEVP